MEQSARRELLGLQFSILVSLDRVRAAHCDPNEGKSMELRLLAKNLDELAKEFENNPDPEDVRAMKLIRLIEESGGRAGFDGELFPFLFDLGEGAD